MTIHAIADLHLDPGGKPMDVFGAKWEHHAEHIFLRWGQNVAPGDLVLLPGDISWAMQLTEAKEQLGMIGALPGIKLLLRGNHDYWWGSVARVREALPEGMYALQNDSFSFGAYVIAGSRGWVLPTDGTSKDDEKVYERELIRLELSLKRARAKSQDAPLIAMMHFPPLTLDQQDTGFTRLLETYRAQHVVYGHLHGAGLKSAFRGERHGICYHQVSCDGLDFCPKAIVTT